MCGAQRQHFRIHDASPQRRHEREAERYLLDEIDRLVDDDLASFKEAATAFLRRPVALDLDAVVAEHARLTERIERFGTCEDALDIWRGLGIAEPERIPSLDLEQFLEAVSRSRMGSVHAAR